jgi:hypothetical protein
MYGERSSAWQQSPPCCDWATEAGLREDYRKYRPNFGRVIS